MRLKFLLFILITFFVKGYSWWDSSHMVVAKIAEENLTEKAKKQTEELIAVLDPYYPETNTFSSAAVWADDVSNSNFAPWVWHGKSLPYDNHFLSKMQKVQIMAKLEASSGATQMRQAVKTLKNKRATKLEKAIMLRFLIHIAGDLHQPLHCISYYSEKFPKGDAGGNMFLLEGKHPNLHALWDSALGRDYIWLKKPIDKEGEKYLEEFKKEVLGMFPLKNLKDADNLDFDSWAKESYDAAIEHAYRGILSSSLPSEEYIMENRRVAYERIALAGYRLSKLLNEIFEEQ